MPAVTVCFPHTREKVVDNCPDKVTKCAATSYSSAEYTSHFSAIYFSRSWPSVSHHENAITPTPPKLLLIAADKSSMRSTIQRSDDGNDPNKSNLIVQKKKQFSHLRPLHVGSVGAGHLWDDPVAI